MDLPYHLKDYHSKLDSLSNQAKSILEFCISNREVENFKKRITEETKLEKDTVQVLTKAILAGYNSSIHTYNWSNQDELTLWELINLKCEDSYKPYFILANLQRGSKTADELEQLYFNSFNQHLDYVFSLEDEDKKQLYRNPKTRYKFLEYEFKARVTQWDDFEDCWDNGIYWEKNFGEDEKAMELINRKLNERRKRADNTT